MVPAISCFGYHSGSRGSTYPIVHNFIFTDSMYLFVNVRKLNYTGILYLKYFPNNTLDDGSQTTAAPARRRRSASPNTFQTRGIVYTPRVWNETSKAWETSDTVEVS